MRHPEGRLVAIQQQMFLATILAEELNMDIEVVLRKLAMAGLRLTPDEQEIATDASAVYPSINNMKKQRLEAVPDLGAE
jgi:uncharacterized Zn finger protein